MNREELIKEISQANLAYSTGLPYLTDAEYDLLWQQLYAIDPHNSLLYHTANQTLGGMTGKVYHKNPIFGTNKAFNMEDLKPFLTRFGSYVLTIEPKYDGCAAIITRTNSGIILTLEGDGRSGRDISHLLPFIKIPFELRHFQSVELIIPLAEWKPSYGANPRNVVAGWIARTHDKPDAQMTAVSHNYGSLYQEFLYAGDLDLFSEYLLKLYNEWSQVYPMDGLMIKVKEEKTRIVAGNNGQVNNWSIAWKPPIQIKETRVANIEWNISRLGRVVPTVVYEPIELCGTINSRVTGNNAKWLFVNKIVLGSLIFVGKAGEIIPKILSVKNAESCTSLLPHQCPKCNNDLCFEGVHLVCNGEKCIAKLIVAISYFYSHKGIKIDGIGEALVEKLLQDQHCYSVLSTKPWALLDMLAYNLVPSVMNTVGITIYSNITEQIFSMSNHCTMAHFVAGLGLPGLAYKSSLRLCQYLKTGHIDTHITESAKQSFVTAAGIYADAIKEMKNFAFAQLPNAAKAVYCITGSLSQSRETIIEILNGYDFEFSSSVTRETNYLVVGQDPGKIKIDKATKYNIPQITEEQLFALLRKE